MIIDFLNLGTQILKYKNYVTARGKEGVNDFVTYRYVYFEGEGRILRHNYVTADTKFENLKNICQALWCVIKS